MPTYLSLAYDGNYVGRDVHGYEWFTYGGNLYMVDPRDDVVMLA